MQTPLQVGDEVTVTLADGTESAAVVTHVNRDGEEPHNAINVDTSDGTQLAGVKHASRRGQSESGVTYRTAEDDAEAQA